MSQFKILSGNKETVEKELNQLKENFFLTVITVVGTAKDLLLIIYLKNKNKKILNKTEEKTEEKTEDKIV